MSSANETAHPLLVAEIGEKEQVSVFTPAAIERYRSREHNSPKR